MPRFFLSLGSNVGDREGHLASALARLRAEGLRIDRVSSVYETEPVGAAAGPGWFLNLAAAGESDLSPEEILGCCARAESAMGRRRLVPGGPREIDVDVLLVGRQERAGASCTIPHPRLHLRRFVLQPLAEIAPDAVHPRLGRTVRELLAALDDPMVVRRLDGGPLDSARSPEVI